VFNAILADWPHPALEGPELGNQALVIEQLDVSLSCHGSNSKYISLLFSFAGSMVWSSPDFLDTTKKTDYIRTGRCEMSEGKTRRRYDRAFKEGAVRLVIENGQMVAVTARDLGITENMLQRWKKEYLEDREHAFPGKGRMEPEDADLHQLKRRIADLEEEREILKKPWPSSPNTPNEVSVHGPVRLRVCGEEDERRIGSQPERLLCLSRAEAKSSGREEREAPSADPPDLGKKPGAFGPPPQYLPVMFFIRSIVKIIVSFPGG
jgi:transposase